MHEGQIVIGHDLDGVIIDIEATKRRLILAHFGVDIIGKVGKEAVAKAVERDPKDPEFVASYQSFQRSLYNDSAINTEMPPVPGALAEIRRLRDAGIPQVVITARNGPAQQFGRDWITARGIGWLSYVAVGTDKGAKVGECRSRKVRSYTDDDLPVLGPLEADGYVRSLYLFSRDHAETVPGGSRIVKVGDWPSLGEYLRNDFGL